MERGGYVYIMSNKNRTVLYIGVTSNLANRVFEHKSGIGSQFTKRYNCIDIIYYEGFTAIEEAIIREKQLKKWKRVWKDKLIISQNPNLADLTDRINHLN
jgi:putative endonuclease